MKLVPAPKIVVGEGAAEVIEAAEAAVVVEAKVAEAAADTMEVVKVVAVEAAADITAAGEDRDGADNGQKWPYRP